MKKKVLAVILAIVSVAALAACGSNGAAEPKADGSAATEKSSSTSADTTIKIGAKSFSESKILGELYALALEAGTLNLQLERIPLNALAPVFAVVSFMPEIVTLESLLQP